MGSTTKEDKAGARALVAAAFDGLVAAAAGDARKLAMLSRKARSVGRDDRAYPLAKAARALAPGDPEILALTQGGIVADVPKFHLPMLRDDARNRLYADAIARVVRPGDVVLDIGSGSGLLAMIAARAGAAHVYSCEMNAAVADVATEIVALNGLGDRVTILPCHSADIDVARDLGGRVDVIISEIFADNLVAEHVLQTMTDVVDRLLKPGGRVMPHRAQIVGALVADERLDPAWLGAVEGFDLTPFMRLANSPLKHNVQAPNLALRSPPVDLFDFDLAGGGPWQPARTTPTLIADGGRVDGVVTWLRFQLDAEAVYENAPHPDARSHWAVSVHPFAQPITPAAGAPVTVHAAHDLNAITIWRDG